MPSAATAVVLVHLGYGPHPRLPLPPSSPSSSTLAAASAAIVQRIRVQSSSF
uniref:Uncharacterized protein n=1 Tax=Oryza sativa subsp. japonica TaxID=39947 RepID=Q8GVM9_ORYSJ|nr:hypothetical protein [Oryza sativa Japonica Group]